MEVGYNGFKKGDKVWVDRTDFVESVKIIREPQVIEKVMPVPVTHEGREIFTYAIDIVGSRYMYSETDLRPYE